MLPKKFLAAAVPAVALLLAPAAGLSQSSALRKVGIIMQFDFKPSKGMLKAIEKGTEQALKPSGIDLAWRMGPGSGDEPLPRLVVLHFTGHCEDEPMSISELHPLGEKTVLAASVVREGIVLPYADIHCDRVQKFLTRWSLANAPVAVGSAVGRVVAHELFHILTGSIKHGTSELSKALVTPEELASHDVGFSRHDLELLRESVQ